MRRIISFVHISLDGFVAGPNGEMNWIKIDQELFDHVEQRIKKCDAALYGRKTFEMMESYWPTAADKPHATKHDIEHSKWYATARKLVLSNTLKEADFKNTTVIGGAISDKINEFRNSDGEDILVFGSPSATHALMKLNLIDGYWMFVNPVVLGKGISLFNGDQVPASLKLISTRTFNSGVVELNYVVEEK